MLNVSVQAHCLRVSQRLEQYFAFHDFCHLFNWFKGFDAPKQIAENINAGLFWEIAEQESKYHYMEPETPVMFYSLG